MAAPKKTTKTPAPKKLTREIIEIPEFYDTEDNLNRLKRSEFPKTKDGNVAFCDYNITKWKILRKKAEAGQGNKKKARLEKRLAAMKKKEEALVAELATL